MKNFIATSVIVILFFYGNTSYAWGPKGHSLVAEVAAHYLSDDAKKNVQQYLGTMSFDTAANWMDAMRSNYEYDFMKPWHYINFEKDVAYTSTSDENALNRITYSINELKHKQLLCTEQIRFDILVLFHLIGDIHQPLHVGYGSDKGGNMLQVEYLDTVKANLHHIWDENLVERNTVTLESILEMANGLSPTEVERTKSLNIIDWMNESRVLIDSAYDYPSFQLDKKYAEKNEQVVKRRILYAGIRLAAVLEKLFKSENTIVPIPLPNSIPATEAINYIDKKVIVCSKVYGMRTNANVTLINIGDRFPNSPLTIVIEAKDRSSFKGDLEELFSNKYICVKGRVSLYNGKVEIHVESPDDIIVQ